MGERLKPWLPVYRRRHVLLMAPLTVACAAVFAVTAPPAGGLQLAVLAAAVAVFGLPHGALDHLVGRRLLRRRWGSRWPLVFGAGYLALAGAVIGGWWAAPRLMLAAFLLYSAWHFGAGDAAASAAGGSRARRLAAARGLLPIALPALFHGAEVTRYFNWLLPPEQALSVGFVAGAAGLLAAAAVPLSLAAALGAAAEGEGSGRRGRELVEIFALVLLFAGAPPLVSFLVYFCGWHSLRHLLELGAELSPRDAGSAARGLALSAWPLTLLTVAAAYPAWRLLRGAGLEGEVALGQVLFIGLAALTVPHMVLGSLAARRVGAEGGSS